MSKPTRIIYKSPYPGISDDQELCVGAAPMTDHGTVPRERDIAAAVSAMPDKWFEDFLVELIGMSRSRAMAVALAVQSTRFGTEHTSAWARAVTLACATQEPTNEHPWPPVETSGRPLFTNLPDSYFEHVYHVHERRSELTGTGDIHGAQYYIVLSGDTYVLTAAYWSESDRQWRMRLRLVDPNLPWREGQARAGALREFWICHSYLRRGDKISDDSTLKSVKLWRTY